MRISDWSADMCSSDLPFFIGGVSPASRQQQPKETIMQSGIRLAATAILALSMCAAHAEEAWPTRAVRWIVPFGAGGTADAAARHITQKLSERWGQQIVIDYRPGANIAIAAAEAARAKPDVYTLFQPMNSKTTTTPFECSKLPY